MVPVTVHQARWVLPVDRPPLDNGAVAVVGGHIVAVGPAPQLRREFSGPIRDHGPGAILPALVNAHVHLEYSALRGRLDPTPNLVTWLSAAIANFAALSCDALMDGIEAALHEAREAGTILVAEISNTGLSRPLLESSPLEYQYFFECLGFNLLASGPLEDDFPWLASPRVQADARVAAAAHAPYSVSAPLLTRIAAWNRPLARPTTIHLAESRDELEFLLTGNGCFRDLLARRGRWYDSYRPPACSPAVYLDNLGFLTPRTLAAHGLWLNDADRQALAARHTTVVLCPRSNLFTGTGFPDLPALLEAGIPLALGTDSLASNQDLNLFAEMLCLQEHFPAIPGDHLLHLATLGGARALGRDAHLGSLTPGKQAALLFVPLDPGGALWPGLLAAGAAGQVSWLNDSGRDTRHDR